MRIVFLGTPAFAVPSLERLASEPGFEAAGVICQPDRPVGRKGELRAPAVKETAQRLGLEIYQPEKIRSDDAFAWMQARQPGAIVVIAYGQIIPRRIFELPRWGTINAHASLLPKYRGAAPIQWAIASGEHITGVTTMKIDTGLDTGDMLLKRSLEIGAHETAPQLSARLAALSAELLVETLRELQAGRIQAEPQNNAEATLAPILKREDGRADWGRPAVELYNRWRGFQPWPGLHTRLQGQQLTIHRCEVDSEPEPSRAAAPGTLLERNGRWLAQCAQGQLVLEEVQLEGRKRMPADAFFRGARVTSGTVLE